MDLFWLGPLCALGSSVSWAMGSAIYGKLSQRHSPFAVNLSRLLVCCPAFIILSFFYAGSWQEGWGAIVAIQKVEYFWLLLSALGMYGLGDGLFFWSTRILGVSGALAIASCFPAWSVLMSLMLGRTTFHSLQVLALVIVMSGIVMVVLMGGQTQLSIVSARRRIFGFLLALIASFAWGLSAFSVAHLGARISPILNNAVRMFFALPMCLAMGRLLYPQSALWLNRIELKKIFWIFLIEGVIGTFLYVYGLAHSPLILGSALVALAPVMSVPLAVFLKVETFSLSKMLAVFWVVFGVILLLRSM